MVGIRIVGGGLVQRMSRVVPMRHGKRLVKLMAAMIRGYRVVHQVHCHPNG